MSQKKRRSKELAPGAFDQSYLQEILKLAKEFVAGKKTVLPVLNCFLFEEGQISASSGDSGVVYRIPSKKIDFKPTSSFCLQADRLWGLVGAIPSDRQIDFRVGKSGIELRAGEFFGQFQKIDTGKFPRIDEPKKQKNVREAAPEFVQALDMVNFSMGMDQTKPELLGIGVQEKGIVYSCDSTRISRCAMGKKKASWSGTLPARIAKMLPLSDESRVSGAELDPEGSRCWAWIGKEITAFQVKAEVEFPPVDHFFKEAQYIWRSGIQIEMDAGQKENLLAALDRLMLFTEGDVYKIIEVYSARGGLKIVANPKNVNPQLTIPNDRAEEFCPVKWKGNKEFSFWVSAPLFREAVVRSQVLYYKEDDQPLYFTDGSGFEHLLLLIRKK